MAERARKRRLQTSIKQEWRSREQENKIRKVLDSLRLIQ
jgi:hypothetical protein